MTADERLALVRLKIERADKHINDLNAEIRRFFNSNPYTIATKHDAQTRTVGSNFSCADVSTILQRPFAAEFREIFPPLFIKPADDLLPLKAGDELLSDAADAEPNKHMQFKFEIVIHEPGVIEGKPLLETLVQFSNRVSGIVNSFRPYLNRIRARQPPQSFLGRRTDHYPLQTSTSSI
jgi:hypothetical protein